MQMQSLSSSKPAVYKQTCTDLWCGCCWCCWRAGAKRPGRRRRPGRRAGRPGACRGGGRRRPLFVCLLVVFKGVLRGGSRPQFTARAMIHLPRCTKPQEYHQHAHAQRTIYRKTKLTPYLRLGLAPAGSGQHSGGERARDGGLELLLDPVVAGLVWFGWGWWVEWIVKRDADDNTNHYHIHTYARLITVARSSRGRPAAPARPPPRAAGAAPYRRAGSGRAPARRGQLFFFGGGGGCMYARVVGWLVGRSVSRLGRSVPAATHSHARTHKTHPCSAASPPPPPPPSPPPAPGRPRRRPREAGGRRWPRAGARWRWGLGRPCPPVACGGGCWFALGTDGAVRLGGLCGPFFFPYHLSTKAGKSIQPNRPPNTPPTNKYDNNHHTYVFSPERYGSSVSLTKSAKYLTTPRVRALSPVAPMSASTRVTNCGLVWVGVFVVW